MDQITQLAGSLGAVCFLAGLLALTICLPVWLWLCVRFFRDVHAIRHSIEAAAYQLSLEDAKPDTRPASRVAHSAFGR